MPSGEEDSVALDADLIKVLAADSRRDILRLLGERRMTLTEISNRLGLGKATVLEHLKRLVEADLVRRQEDERLWVYYELSRKGGRFVNPGRTRFYLLLTGAFLAVALGVALASAMMGDDDAPTQAPAAPDPLQVELSGARTTDDGLFAVTARVRDAQSGEVQAFLVDERAAQGVHRSGAPVMGVSLEKAPPSAFVEDGSAADGDGAAADDSPTSAPAAPTTPKPASGPFGYHGGSDTIQLDLRTSAALPPGAYYVVVVDAAGRPARSPEPALVVPDVQADLSRGVAWRGVDDGVDVALSGAGAVDGAGILVLSVAGDSQGALRIAVSNGTARVDAAQLDALEPARYTLAFHPDGDAPAVRLAQTLDVRDPRVVFAPRIVPAEANATVRLSIVGPSPGIEVPVVLDGVPSANATTGNVTVLRLPGLDAGPHEMQVGRLANLTLEARPQVAASVAGNGTAWTLSAPSGSPLADAPVLLDGASVGRTDANGTFAFVSVPDGEHVVRVGDATTLSRAANGTFAPAAPSLQHRLSAPNASAPAGVLAFQVEASNPHPFSVLATLALSVDDVPLDARVVAVPAGGNVTLDLAYDGLEPGEHRVRAHAVAFREIAGLPPTHPGGAPDASPGADDGTDSGSSGRADVLLGSDGDAPAIVVSVSRQPVEFELLPDARLLPLSPTSDHAIGEPAGVPLPPLALVLAALGAAAWSRRCLRGPER